MMKQKSSALGGFVAGSAIGMAAAVGVMMSMPRVGGPVKRMLRKQGAKLLQNFM